MIIKPSVVGLEETREYQKITGPVRFPLSVVVLKAVLDLGLGNNSLFNRGLQFGLGTCGWFEEDLLKARMLPKGDRILTYVKPDELRTSV